VPSSTWTARCSLTTPTVKRGMHPRRLLQQQAGMRGPKTERLDRRDSLVPFLTLTRRLRPMLPLLRRRGVFRAVDDPAQNAPHNHPRLVGAHMLLAARINRHIRIGHLQDMLVF
jgi:hypothetical protein